MNSSRCILWFATCCLLLSCSQGINNDDVITIPLGASVGKDNQPIDPMMLKVVDVTRMESTDGCFLRRGRYFDIDDKSVGVYDGERILKVGIGQGKIQLNISRIGRGPGEYLGVDGCRYDHDNKWYVVTSLLDGKVIWYDENGRLAKEMTVGDRGAFCPMDAGHYAYVKPYDADEDFEIYDSEGSLIRRSVLGHKGVPTQMLYSQSFKCFNGQYYFAPTLSDTLYHVNAEKDVPFLVFDKGDKKIPEEYYSNITSHDLSDYINSLSFYICGDMLFARFWCKGKMFMEIWDLTDRRLAFKSELSSEFDEYGFPVQVNGETVYVWPDDVSGNILYCTLLHREAQKLFPDLSEDANPVFLRICVN